MDHTVPDVPNVRAVQPLRSVQKEIGNNHWKSRLASGEDSDDRLGSSFAYVAARATIGLAASCDLNIATAQIRRK
jgi:hypothetical protein